MGRASDAEKAQRLNRARDLVRQFKHLPDAVERLRTTALSLLGRHIDICSKRSG